MPDKLQNTSGEAVNHIFTASCGPSTRCLFQHCYQNSCLPKKCLWAHICLLLEGAKRRTDCFERTEVGKRPWKPDSSHEGWMQLATTSGHRGQDSTCILGSVQLATLAFTKTRCSSAPFAASQEVARKIYVKGIKSFTRGKHQWPPAQILPVIDCFALSVGFNHPQIVIHTLENRLARA